VGLARKVFGVTEIRQGAIHIILGTVHENSKLVLVYG
jgi:hypothetical protein